MAHFIQEDDEDHNIPPFPFLCLLVSGGNSQIVKVNAYNDMEVIGQTIDDAAGEAIDKCSKVMGLGYPGGPIIDKLARQGNPKAFTFSKPHISGLEDRKSTRLNSSHANISYAVFCLKKKKITNTYH